MLVHRYMLRPCYKYIVMTFTEMTYWKMCEIIRLILLDVHLRKMLCYVSHNAVGIAHAKEKEHHSTVTL